MKKFIAFIILLFSINAFAQKAIPYIGSIVVCSLVLECDIQSVQSEGNLFFASLEPHNPSTYSVKNLIKKEIVDRYGFLVANNWKVLENTTNISLTLLTPNQEIGIIFIYDDILKSIDILVRPAEL